MDIIPEDEPFNPDSIPIDYDTVIYEWGSIAIKQIIGYPNEVFTLTSNLVARLVRK